MDFEIPENIVLSEADKFLLNYIKELENEIEKLKEHNHSVIVNDYYVVSSPPLNKRLSQRL